MPDSAPTPPRCPICGDIVGVYEPAVSATADGLRISGVRPAPELDVAGTYHRDCLERPER